VSHEILDEAIQITDVDGDLFEISRPIGSAYRFVLDADPRDGDSNLVGISPEDARALAEFLTGGTK
jgi:hypothetical protein